MFSLLYKKQNPGNSIRCMHATVNFNKRAVKVDLRIYFQSEGAPSSTAFISWTYFVAPHFN